MPFVRLALLPYVDIKLPPTEVVFVLLFPLAFWTYGKKLWLQKPWLMWGFVAYVLANVASALVAGQSASILEAFGRLYLVLLALVVAVWVSEPEEHRVRKILDAFLYGTTVLAACAYLGYFAAILGYGNSLVQVYGNYPYLGTLYRASGFTGGPGMLIIVLLLPTLYAWRSWREGKRSLGSFAFLLPLAGLTFSKEVLLLGLGLLLVDPWFRGRGRRMQGWLIGAVAVVFWFGTHFIVQQRQPVATSSLAGTEYTSGNLVWVGEKYQLLETSYSALKRAGVSVSRKYPIFGVGPGQFGHYLPAEQAAGIYPSHLPHYDPHSTWLGALSETGIAGLLALLLLSVLLYQQFSRLPLANAEAGMVLCLQIFLLLLLISSVSKDVANFRFVWVVIGLLLGLANGTKRLS
jgi:O-antigen ligase